MHVHVRVHMGALVLSTINLDRVLVKQVHVPVVHTNKHATANDVANRSWDHSLPDVQSNGKIGCLEPDGERHVEHVGDNVLKAEDNEGEDGPPHADDFGGKILGLDTEEDSKTYEPVAADALEEDLVNLGRDLFLAGERNDDFFVG
jgi:hypothetical protein